MIKTLLFFVNLLRSPTGFSSVSLIMFGVWINMYATFSSSSDYHVIASIGSEAQWGSLFVIVGLANVIIYFCNWSMTLNSSYVYWILSIFAAIALTTCYLFILLMLAQGNFAAGTTPFLFNFTAFSLLVFMRRVGLLTVLERADAVRYSV